MSRHTLSSILLTLGLLATAHTEIDFGDYASSTLTQKAWQARDSDELNNALVYVDKCIELYEAEALSMQASLTTFPATEPKENVFTYWALNDVGTCYFIKGEILLKQNQHAAARAAFEKLVEQLGYAQCWDPRGWFWKPAEAAKQKILEIDFDLE
jgi:predicted negative regulator of RcsB-dependent stress response